MPARRSDDAESSPLLLLSSNSGWNVAIFRTRLMQALQTAGYKLEIAVPLDAYAVQLAEDGFTNHELPLERAGMNPLAELRLLRRYVALMRALRPAAFLGFTVKPNIYGSLAAGIAGIPVINNISGLGTLFLGSARRQRLALALYRLALKRSAIVFFQNPDDRELFLAAGVVRPSQVRLLPGSGVDLDRFTPTEQPDGPPTFLFIGRLLADKGVREYAEAALIVREQIRDARFEIIGALDPHNRSAVNRAEVDRWSNAGDVHFLGEATDVRPHIARATAVVLPSYREGVPRVLLEAAAMGRPLIATDVPGCRSVVDHESNGYLCAARDPKALAEAMIRLARLPRAGRNVLGEAARAKVEREFSEQRVIDAYIEALRDITGASGVGAA